MTTTSTRPARDHSTVQRFLQHSGEHPHQQQDGHRPFKEAHERLHKMPRQACPQCSKSYKYYCYHCMLPFEPPCADSSSGTEHSDAVQTKGGRKLPIAKLASREDSPSNDSVIPVVRLPVRCIVLQHPNECKSKSTAIHAKLLAPHDVDIFEFPHIPEHLQFTAENALLLYPSKDALSVRDVVREMHQERRMRAKAAEQEQQNNDGGNISTRREAGDVADTAVPGRDSLQYVIFIDSTWQQSKSILRDPRLQHVRRVKIASHKTCFWRYQTFSEEFLATIEAIYFFYREFATFDNVMRMAGAQQADIVDKMQQMDQNELESQYYRGEFDSLLFYFVFLYDLIQGVYKRDRSKNFQHIEGWVQYDDSTGDTDRDAKRIKKQ